MGLPSRLRHVLLVLVGLAGGCNVVSGLALPELDAGEAGASAVEEDGGGGDRQTVIADCEAQHVTWGDAGCSARLEERLASGAMRRLDRAVSDAGPSGHVIVRCEDGRISSAESRCITPTLIDLSTPTACVSGFCSAAAVGQCGVPDVAVANEICVGRGFQIQIGFTTAPGPLARQCRPGGIGCLENENPTCNIIFTSVTCGG
jgi:hypothetical protein